MLEEKPIIDNMADLAKFIETADLEGAVVLALNKQGQIHIIQVNGHRDTMDKFAFGMGVWLEANVDFASSKPRFSDRSRRAKGLRS